MNFRKTRFLPKLEALEDRTVPATYQLVSGSLFISNQTGTLTITSTGGTSVQAQDGAGPKLSFTGVGTVYVTGTNLGQQVTFNDTTTFNGNFFVNTGNGNDSVTLAGGKLLGNVTVMGGLGNDFIQINADGNTVGGNVTYSDNAGNDRIDFSGTVLGSATVTGANTITVAGTGVAAGISGNATFTNLGDGFPVNFKTFNAPAVTFGKDLSVTTGSAADTVTFGAAGGTTVSGNATFNLGEGLNSLTVGTNADVFNGNFSYSAGTGNDTVTVNAKAAFNGNFTTSLGDGNNTYNTSTGFSVAGNATLNAGNGSNGFLGFGNVAGNMNINFGNGNNNFTINRNVSGDVNITLGNGNNGVVFSSGTSSVGGTIHIRTGNGNNDIQLNRSQTYVLDIQLGNGDDTVESVAENPVFTGLIDGGGRITANVFNQGGATLSPNLVIKNFP
jgi:hypothetical protein